MIMRKVDKKMIVTMRRRNKSINNKMMNQKKFIGRKTR